MSHWKRIIVPAVLALVAFPVAPQSRPTPQRPESPCPDWRWIGIKVDRDAWCPRVDGWIGRLLFAPPRSRTSPRDLPPALRSFCLYEASNQVNHLHSRYIHVLESEEGLSRVARDCAVVIPSGELQKATHLVLKKQFLSQVGLSASLPPLPPSGASSNARLALLDTVPTKPNNPHLHIPPNGKSKHGFTLANLAHDLLCDSGCVADITTQLALPIVKFDPNNPSKHWLDKVNGGYVGTLGHLAAAINSEVAAWDPSENPHLVLNLSVAWDPALGGDLADDFNDTAPPVLAVYEALEYAACRGALVVAAAGNLLGGPGPESGPLLPAAWEEQPAPKRKKCRKDYQVSTSSSRSSGYQPLLYAAGGVGADGVDLGNARPDGMPRLVAYGDHAVTNGPQGNPTATLTGSSVPTVVVSAAAAAVWHYRPELTSHDVMKLVYEAGDLDGLNADFYLGKPPQPRRHVSLCKAVQKACTQAGNCPNSITCNSWSKNLLAFGNVNLINFYGSPGPQTIGVSKFKSTGQSQKCKTKFFHTSNGKLPVPLGSPCPFWMLPGLMAQAWVGPQPEADPCPSCAYHQTSGKSPNTLLIEISESFKGKLTDPTLVVGDIMYRLPISQQLVARDKVEIKGIPSLNPSKSNQISLQFTVDGKSSAMSPVLIVQ